MLWEISSSHYKNKIEFQLMLPHLHEDNNAIEGAIRIWETQFIVIMYSLDRRFPLQIEDRLIEQTNITFNLLRPSRLHLKMIVETMLNGLCFPRN